ncbi:unnamed protein product [Ranitomeya imitator]|uniref:C2H2-type domain-containing protein n=1 Tax=Ranitomeya imitator TaxID=111125 RepID=A0ABN9L2C9_9NEOB|nr:unnamed protein product [Ranitomeya imitator]
MAEDDLDIMSKKIINRSIYLIYLLTGEQYMLVKQTTNEQIFGTIPDSLLGRKKTMMSQMLPPIQDNSEKIREVNNQITQFLSGKLSAHYEGSPGIFSADEWEFLECRKDFDSAILKNKYNNLKDIPREAAIDSLVAAKKQMLQKFFEASCQAQATAAEGSSNLLVGPPAMSQSLPDLPTEQKTRNQEFFASPPPEQNTSLGVSSSRFTPVNFPQRFSCPVCGKSFPQKRNLKVHKRIHTSPFAKDGMDPTEQEYLPSSVRNEPDEYYLCTECDLSFFHKPSYLRHMKIHEPKEEFRCLDCSQVFTTNNLLSKHQTSTTVGQMYPCIICGKIFIYNKCLLYHQKSHRMLTNFSCLQCDKTFASKNGLVKHHQKAHGQNVQSSKNDFLMMIPQLRQLKSLVPAGNL